MKAPIFIFGTSRSRTTLTGRILGRHPQIFVGGEVRFFEDIYARRQQLGNPASPVAMQQIFERFATLYERYNAKADQERMNKLLADGAMVEHLTTSNRDYRDVLSRFMQLQTDQAKKKRWANHVPKEVFHIKDILSFYPEAKFIFCVRDIRDFLVSYQNRWRVANPGDSDRFKRLYHPIVASLIWKATVKQIMRARSIIPAGNALTIQYASLVSKPVDPIQRLCSFIQEDYHDSLLQVGSNNSSFGVQEQGIFTSSVRSRQHQLTNEEHYIAVRIAKKELQHLGYSTTRVSPHPGKLAKIGLQ